MPDMPEHTQEKVYDQTVASMNILLHAKSKLSTSNSLWESILVYHLRKIFPKHADFAES